MQTKNTFSFIFQFTQKTVHYPRLLNDTELSSPVCKQKKNIWTYSLVIFELSMFTLILLFISIMGCASYYVPLHYVH